jgi:TfoX/Sxy family transcriptional regulator of competence genes
MSKPKSEAPAEKVALYENLIATSPEVELKGAKMPYTSLNGHMFSFLTSTGTLALRLPADAREAFIEKYETSMCVQHGRVMQEYVEVPDALLRQTSKLKEYFTQSRDYVASLAPKPTTRPKQKATASKKVTPRK